MSHGHNNKKPLEKSSNHGAQSKETSIDSEEIKDQIANL